MRTESRQGVLDIRHAPRYVLAAAVGAAALVLAGLPVVTLLVLQVAVACPLLAIAMSRPRDRRTE